MSLKRNGLEDGSTEVTPGAEALARVEAGKMTRRAALSKFGIRAGAAVFAAMNVDTIARMVGVEMQRQGKNNRVADKLAHEFRNAGIAFADDNGGSGSSGLAKPPCGDPCVPNCVAPPFYTCVPCSGFTCNGNSQPVQQQCKDQTTGTLCRQCCDALNAGGNGSAAALCKLGCNVAT